MFWKLHDPTTLNRQGNDVGTQYRSAIFYHSAAQKKAAEASRSALEAGRPGPELSSPAPSTRAGPRRSSACPVIPSPAPGREVPTGLIGEPPSAPGVVGHWPRVRQPLPACGP